MRKAIPLFIALFALICLNNRVSAQNIFKDLDTAANVSSGPQDFININGTMYFITTGGATYKHRLWRSDGTAANTTILKDSLITTNVGGIIKLINVNGTLFFAINKNGSATTATLTELWKSNGTPGGTVLVDTLTNPAPLSGTGSFPPGNYTAVGDKLFFQMGKNNGIELWVSDGTAAGTKEVSDLAPGSGSGYQYGGATYRPMGAFDGKVYFEGTVTGLGNTELYASDGTTTTLVKEINPGSASSEPAGWIVYNNELYFVAEDTGSAIGLWKTDGDTVVKVFQNAKSCSNTFAIFKNTLYFINGIDLWKTNGTTGGTVFVTDSANVIIGANNDYLFTQYMKSLSVAPYYEMLYKRTDGSSGGTIVSKDLGAAASFVVLNNNMYQTRADTGGVYTSSLWVTDGTEGGTSKLFGGQYPGIPFVYSDTVFFSNFGTGTGYELWYYVPTGTVGIISAEQDKNMSIYPNPSTGLFTILQKDNTSKISVEVYNVVGEKVLQKQNSNQIDLSNAPRGVYFVKAYEGDKSYTQKIILQ